MMEGKVMKFDPQNTKEFNFGFCKLLVDFGRYNIVHFKDNMSGHGHLLLNRVVHPVRMTYDTQSGTRNVEGWSIVRYFEDLKDFDNCKTVDGLSQAIFFCKQDEVWSASDGSRLDLSANM